MNFAHKFKALIFVCYLNFILLWLQLYNLIFEFIHLFGQIYHLPLVFIFFLNILWIWLLFLLLLERLILRTRYSVFSSKFLILFYLLFLFYFHTCLFPFLELIVYISDLNYTSIILFIHNQLKYIYIGLKHSFFYNQLLNLLTLLLLWKIKYCELMFNFFITHQGFSYFEIFYFLPITDLFILNLA